MTTSSSSFRRAFEAVKVEDRIATLVPMSAAGAVAQLRVLCDFARDFEWDEWADEIAGNLIAGLERLGATAPKSADGDAA